MTCALCHGPLRSDGTQVRDPAYTGPAGHYVHLGRHEADTVPGPALCYDCWVTEWFLRREWADEIDHLIACLYARMSQKEIAKRIGASVRGVQRKTAWLRANQQIILDWVAEYMPSQLTQ